MYVLRPFQWSVSLHTTPYFKPAYVARYDEHMGQRIEEPLAISVPEEYGNSLCAIINK